MAVSKKTKKTKEDSSTSIISLKQWETKNSNCKEKASSYPFSQEMDCLQRKPYHQGFSEQNGILT